MFYVFFDGAWHPLGEDETTTCCGAVIPHGTEFARAVPEGGTLHGDTPAEKPKPATKSKSKAKAKK